MDAEIEGWVREVVEEYEAGAVKRVPSERHLMRLIAAQAEELEKPRTRIEMIIRSVNPVHGRARYMSFIDRYMEYILASEGDETGPRIFYLGWAAGMIEGAQAIASLTNVLHRERKNLI